MVAVVPNPGCILESPRPHSKIIETKSLKTGPGTLPTRYQLVSKTH